MHQTASGMMGDRISDTTCRDAQNGIRHDGRENCKCISTLPNDNKGGIHQTESARNCESNSQGEIANIDECNEIFL